MAKQALLHDCGVSVQSHVFSPKFTAFTVAGPRIENRDMKKEVFMAKTWEWKRELKLLPL